MMAEIVYREVSHTATSGNKRCILAARDATERTDHPPSKPSDRLGSASRPPMNPGKLPNAAPAIEISQGSVLLGSGEAQCQR